MLKKIGLALLVPIIGSQIWVGTSVAASQSNASSSTTTVTKSGAEQGLGYAVKPKLPSNQRHGIQGYYDLKIAPGQEQTVSGTIYNLNQQTLKVQPQLNLATTNSTGNVDYGTTKNAMDSSLPHRITNLAHFTQSTITIPGNGQATYHFKIKMPKQAFRGVLAGGIRFYNLSQDQQQKRQNLQFKNEYAYVIGLVLQNSTKAVAPVIKLGTVQAKTVNGGNTIVSQLHNTAATYFNGFDLKAVVTKNGSTKTVYSGTSQNLAMAPNSIMAYPLSLKGTPLRSGDYVMHVTVIPKHGEPLNFTRQFKITAQTASISNKNDVYIAAAAKADAQAQAQQRQVILISVLGTLGGLAVIAALWWFIRKRH